MSPSRTSHVDPSDPAAAAGYAEAPPRIGFFTDTSICIGCKACEVACKEWNHVPSGRLELLGTSYDNTGGLGADSWRHVAFVEQPGGAARPEPGWRPATPEVPRPAEEVARPALSGRDGDGSNVGLRWLMMSDVCKHCTRAACLDVCPTGSLFRTELGTVVVQEDICNGCGYCIPACPFGVIDQRRGDGRAWKCTLCYDRLKAGLEPACAAACPTDSIQFGSLDELRQRAARRVERLRHDGVGTARLYADDPHDGVGGGGAFFLLLDQPEVYGLPPDPVVTTRDLPAMWRRAGAAAITMAMGTIAAFAGRRR